MHRPPRLEYPGALYHVTARGVQQNAIFADDTDRSSLLAILARSLDACHARAFAFCLMGNHYHFVLQTHEPNLSTLMRRVNSVYSMTFNRRHDRHGHLFEGRFKALHVDRDAYLLEVCRYVDLNPVRAGLVERPQQWAWSSYRAHAGYVAAPHWLATQDLHGLFTGAGADEGAQGERRYSAWVAAGRGVRLWQNALREGVYLGDEAFVERLKKGRA
jgi:REP element-mobilizing transposase RayT